MLKPLKILTLLLVALLVLAALASVLVLRDPSSVARLLEKAAESGGYRLEITGPARLRFQPRFGIEMESLQIWMAGQDASDSQAVPVATADEVWLQVPPPVLLGGLLEVVGGEWQGTVHVKADELRTGGLIFTGLAGSTHLTPDQLETQWSASEFYGGTLSARYLRQPGLAPVSDSSEMHHRLQAQVESAQLLPLLQALYGDALLSGRGDLDLDLETSGQLSFVQGDPEPWRAQLGGEVDLSVRDARIQGLDLAPLVRALGGNQEDLDAATRLSRLDGRAQGQDGRFELVGLQGLSPMLEFSGRGQVDVVAEQLELDLNALTLERPERENWNQAAGILIPIQARGDWGKPEWRVDLEPVVKQGAARALDRHSDRLKELEEQIGIPGLERGLRGLLGL